MDRVNIILTIGLLISTIVAIVFIVLSIAESNANKREEAPPPVYEPMDIKLVMTNAGQPFYIQRFMAFDEDGHNIFQGLPDKGVAYNAPIYPAGITSAQLDNIFNGRSVSYCATQPGDQATITIKGKAGSTPFWSRLFQIVVVGDFSGQHNSTLNGLQMSVDTGNGIVTSSPAVCPASLDQRNANGDFRPVALRWYPFANRGPDIEVSNRMPRSDYGGDNIYASDINWF